MKQYRDKLLDKGIRQSMSRKGNCYNNQRIMTKLNGLTPITYRHQSINQVILN